MIAEGDEQSGPTCLDWNGPEEGDECDDSVWITNDWGDELLEVRHGDNVEANKDIASAVVEKINALGVDMDTAAGLILEYVEQEGRANV